MKEYKDIEFTCKNCGKTFKKSEKYILKNKGVLPKFCSQECSKEYRSKITDVIVNCAFCGKEKVIKQSEYKKSKNKKFFCNHSCSAKYNNLKREKKEVKNDLYDECPICGGKKLKTSKICNKCVGSKYDSKTLGEILGDGKYSAHKCTEIRKRAKKVIETSNKEKVCNYCKNHEYDKILEVHHIKSIMSFDKNATVSEINDIDNLIWLCPNHHRMLELGLINLDD